MEHRVRLARTIEQGCRKGVEAMLSKLQARMLPGKKQMRRLAEIGESMSDRTEFDGFRARSDNERNTTLAQLPP
jgi:hypothetical protein